MKYQQKNAALYHRCSTLDQDPTLAREELRTAATTRGMEIALEVEEQGSGARNDRPGLQKILDAARKGKIGAVLVWKLDRFGRSALDLLANLRTLQDAGVRFVAVTQGIDIKPEGDPLSRLLVTMLAGIAEFERDLIRERTVLGLEKARRAGKHLGRPRVDVDVPKALELRAAGKSYQHIAKILNVSVGKVHGAIKAASGSVHKTSVESAS